MSKVNGKNKGNTFERKISNLLSERFKNFLNIEKGFRRNADSGSFFGGKNQDRLDVYGDNSKNLGDIISPLNFKYSIECKHYKSPPSFSSIISGTIPEWDKWLKQAEQDSINSGKGVLLIIKYNNVSEIVLISNELTCSQKKYSYKGYNVYLLDDFLKEDDSFYFTAT